MAQNNIRVLEALRALTTLTELTNLVHEADLACDIASQRRWWVRAINQRRSQQGASEQLVREMRRHDDEEFFQFTRLSIAKFDELLVLVGPSLLKQNSRKDVLSPYLRLLITLRYLATGESFKSLHLTFRVGRSTVAEVVYSTCKVIQKILQPSCLPALTKNRLLATADGFKRRTSYPHILGAIDGKHMNLKAPKNSGTKFYNYKKTFSVVLMAVCDSRM